MSDLLAKCEVCGALLDEEDLFCANCGTAAPFAEPAAATTTLPAEITTHNFECASCGASMSYSASSGALQCPFCGSERLQPRPDRKVLSPRRVVPFRIDHGAAADNLRRWLGAGFWRPGDLARTAAVDKISALYIPYWVFSAETHTYWTADSGDAPAGARAGWVPITGEHRDSYRGLLIGASGALNPAETDAICPFDLSDAVPPHEVDMSAVVVEQFTVPRKYARPLARAGLEASEAEVCARQHISGRHRNLKVNVRIEQLQSEPSLLPVWIMAYRYRRDLYRFVINGQTGKATGQAPVSKLKIIAAVILVVAFVLLAVLLATLAR
jgi:DNA-directed RNA polymerase subunit RPC12/RpoP